MLVFIWNFMSFAQVHTRSVVGISAPSVTVEVHLSQGLHALTIVGLPEASVRESKDRVRSAILNSGFDFPSRRLTINLAPADLPKDGARLDLPIAIGILAASGQIDERVLDGFEFIGELALNGDLRDVTGALAIARTLKDGKRTLIAPIQSAKNQRKSVASQYFPPPRYQPSAIIYIMWQAIHTPLRYPSPYHWQLRAGKAINSIWPMSKDSITLAVR